jgi:peroxiredoxin (alkyl hydroperoxide reductase subunit C)
LAAVATKYEDLKKLDVEVLSISVDSHFVHKIWQEEELSKMVEGGVPFPMLSDAGGKIGSIYGVYNEAGGVNTRGRFIIPAGRPECKRAISTGPGISIGPKEQGFGGHTVRLAAWQTNP